MEYREEFETTEEQMCYGDADRDFIWQEKMLCRNSA
jgi:hypothetical protein